MAERVIADDCSTALAALQLKKLLVNGTPLSTETDINNLMALTNAAGISTAALSEFILLKAELEKAEANIKSVPLADKGAALKDMADIIARMNTAKTQFETDVNNFKLDPVSIQFEMQDDTSKSSSSSSAAKQAETDWKNVLDKETDLLEK